MVLSLKKFHWNCYILLTILNFNPVIAKEYFVSTIGDDKNLGTVQSPWKTIHKANEMLRPGDILYVRQGYYRETISPSSDGTSQAPILYSGYLL